jgi:hypothetical protein
MAIATEQKTLLLVLLTVGVISIISVRSIEVKTITIAPMTVLHLLRYLVQTT